MDQDSPATDQKSAQRNRGGRPRTSQPGISVSTWLPETEADRLIRLASRRGESVSQTVRRLLTIRLR